MISDPCHLRHVLTRYNERHFEATKSFSQNCQISFVALPKCALSPVKAGPNREATMLWNWPVAVLLVTCLASFTWAMNHFFTQPMGMTPGMKVIRTCGTLFGALHLCTILWPDPMTPERACAGLMLYSAALGLFWWTIATHRRTPLSAAFSPDAPQHLVQQGPYNFVRHPFYT